MPQWYSRNLGTIFVWPFSLLFRTQTWHLEPIVLDYLGGNWIHFYMLMVNEQIVQNNFIIVSQLWEMFLSLTSLYMVNFEICRHVTHALCRVGRDTFYVNVAASVCSIYRLLRVSIVKFKKQDSKCWKQSSLPLLYMICQWFQCYINFTVSPILTGIYNYYNYALINKGINMEKIFDFMPNLPALCLHLDQNHGF